MHNLPVASRQAAIRHKAFAITFKRGWLNDFETFAAPTGKLEVLGDFNVDLPVSKNKLQQTTLFYFLISNNRNFFLYTALHLTLISVKKHLSLHC